MFHFYNAFLLSLFFTYSISIDIKNHHSNRSIASSRSIYDLVQIRRAAARLAAHYNRTHQKTNEFYQVDYNSLDKYNNNNRHLSTRETTVSNSNYNRYLVERLRIIIITSSIAVGFMILVVIICVVIRYTRNKYPTSTERIEQRKPLNKSRKTNKTTSYYFEPSYDKRNFSRKPRTLPTAV